MIEHLYEPPLPHLSLEQAAFNLGFACRWIRMPVRLCWNLGIPLYDPEYDISKLVDRIDDFLLVLSGRLHWNVFDRLPTELEKTKKQLLILVEACREPWRYHGIRVDRWKIPWGNSHRRLCILADAGIPPADPLHPLYALGAALGGFVVALQEEMPPQTVAGLPRFPLDLEDLPDFYPVASAAARTPAWLREAVPLLGTIADRAGGDGREWDRLGDLGAILDAAVEQLGCRDSFASITVEEMVDRLCEDIFMALRSPSAGPGDILPRWCSRGGKLYYEGEEAREIRNASNVKIVKIVAAFQKASWPTRLGLAEINEIEGPEIYREQVSDQVKSLNKGLRFIRFSARRGGDAVEWNRQ
ncbi:hypothetical protein [Tautonia plasticadhaerens]|uniref:hypothetical protein n=1 Tax=Tautonia plasticadhaerens TaxID=2527974 RepID=UPI0011A5BC05|nr:hypothetical protein [Tautonia plasticadhaerens]